MADPQSGVHTEKQMAQRVEQVEALELTLQGQRVGVLVHYSGGKNILIFDPAFVALKQRPLVTLTERAKPGYLAKPQLRSHRLPPLLSNLLPEGALRERFALELKVDLFDEFPMLASSGRDLPGALVATPLKGGDIPGWALNSREQVEPVPVDIRETANRFSLAGVQMKFSGIRRDSWFTVDLSIDDSDDHWIIKTPSPTHAHVPENEYSVMKLAEAIGVKIPEIQLVEVERLEGLKGINMPNEPYAYAIKRFDRGAFGRAHTEDFAQILGLYPSDKYEKANYEIIGRLIYQYGDDPLTDLQQFARRLLANILLANGDAHLKNWSIIYPKPNQIRLAPAYDIVATLPYIPNENGMALKMGGRKAWRELNFDTFKLWSDRIGAPWPAIKVHLEDAMRMARQRWPEMLEQLPMIESHKRVLIEHWGQLQSDFRIKV